MILMMMMKMLMMMSRRKEKQKERVRERVSEISIPIDDVDHQTRYMHWLKGGSSGVTDASTYTWKHMPF